MENVGDTYKTSRLVMVVLVLGGIVASVGRTVWTPGEKIGPLITHEPVYRIDVRLDRQTVGSGGKEFPLRPGMLASADILLEKRTVFEWVFEPVLMLRERLR